MEIQDYVKFSMLFDIYGKLLSKKQYEVLDKYLNCDLSESELAELDSGSRQAIHDAIKKAKKQLVNFEINCNFLSSKEEWIKKLEKVKNYLSQNKTNEAVKLIDSMINNKD